MKACSTFLAIGSAVVPLALAGVTRIRTSGNEVQIKELAARDTNTGYRTVGSSGCSPQMVFLPPYTNTAIFIDNYHHNAGGPGYDVATATHSKESYVYDGTDVSVFGTEFNLSSNTVRPVHPLSNTFCSAGAFFPNGTLLNLAGAEGEASGDPVFEGFDKLRTYNPGPCNGACDMDWTELTAKLQVYRWYATAMTLRDGSILMVGGSNKGGLVLNEASINVPTYEIIHNDGTTPKAPVTLPILEFTEAENLTPNKSYNLYPILYGIPNLDGVDSVFTIAGNQTILWDYNNDVLIKTLPDTPMQPRTFPSSATSVMLPLEGPDYKAKILLCGGCSGDLPVPKTLDDCYTIIPEDEGAAWVEDDRLPNGGQVLTDGVLLPDGTVLFINGAHVGSAGGLQADDPAFVPLIYDPAAAAGSRFTAQPATTIPRLYHSVATLLPSGEVLVAGSNPVVGYSLTGQVGSGWPKFNNNGHQAAINQLQYKTSSYPTEYRVEIFSPPYLHKDAPRGRPAISKIAGAMAFNESIVIDAAMGNGDSVMPASGTVVVEVNLVAPGFHTHAQGMGQRMVKLDSEVLQSKTQLQVTGPRDASVMPPGVYLLFVVVDGLPSEGQWVNLV